MLFIVLAMAAATCPYSDNQWTPILSKSDLSQEAVVAFGELADVNEPMNKTDVIMPDSPPMRRLVKGRARGCDLIIDYEHGGVGHGFSSARLLFQENHWIVLSYH